MVTLEVGVVSKTLGATRYGYQKRQNSDLESLSTGIIAIQYSYSIIITGTSQTANTVKRHSEAEF
jgi:hypothetical protein